MKLKFSIFRAQAQKEGPQGSQGSQGAQGPQGSQGAGLIYWNSVGTMTTNSMALKIQVKIMYK